MINWGSNEFNSVLNWFLDIILTGFRQDFFYYYLDLQTKKSSKIYFLHHL